MTLTWHGEAAKRRVKKSTSESLLALAREVKKQLQKELDRPFPPASKPGEFPRRRTGKLMRTVQISSVRETAKARLVSVLYGVFYGDILVKKGRLGPADVMKNMREYFRAFNARGKQAKR